MSAFHPSLKNEVFNRGVAPDGFLSELVEWGKKASDDIFAPNANFDIFNRTRAELGPWDSLLTRKAAMLEILRVLAGFESSWDWMDGIDTSRAGETTPENAEAGAWQQSWDSRKLDAGLRTFLVANGVTDGVGFQRKTKFNHAFAMEYTARLLRADSTDPKRLANGPLYKGRERIYIRKSLRGPEQSVYPWLRRDAAETFESLLSA